MVRIRITLSTDEIPDYALLYKNTVGFMDVYDDDQLLRRRKLTNEEAKQEQEFRESILASFRPTSVFLEV